MRLFSVSASTKMRRVDLVLSALFDQYSIALNRLKPTFRSMSRLSKALVILGALLIWYTLIGFLIAPPLIRHFAERALRENFSPDSAVAKVRINPFRGSVVVEGLRVADKAGAWSVEWDVAEVNLDSATVYEWYPVLDGVRFVGADVFVEKRPAELVAPAPEEASGDWREAVNTLNLAEIPQVQIDLLEFVEGRFRFMDLSAAAIYEKTIAPINFTLRDLTTVADGDSEMSFVAKTDQGAVLSWEGDFRSQPMRTEGSFSLSGLAMHSLSPYFAHYITFNLERAIFGLRFDYALDLGDLENLLKISDGGVSLEEIRCQVLDASDRLITIDSVAASGLAFEFPQMALGVGSIAISDGETRIYRDAGGEVNLSRLIALPPKVEAESVEPPDGPSAEPSLPPLTYRIDRIVLNDYSVSWEEAVDASQANLVVKVPRMEITNVTSDTELPFGLDAEYQIGDAGKIGIDGTVLADGPELDLNITAASVPLVPFAPYAKRYGNMEISQGAVNFSGGVNYAAAGKQVVQGDLSIDDLAMVYGAGTDVAWNRFDVQGLLLDLSPLNVSVERISLTAPQVSYVQGASTNEAGEGVAVDQTEAADSDSGSRTTPVKIDSIAVTEGRFVFEDQSLEPAPKLIIDAMDLRVSDLDLASAQPANVRFESAVNGSDFSVEGILSLNAPKEATQLKASLKGLALPAFSGYTGRAVGRAVDSGRFGLEADWTIEGQQLKASNKIRIEQLKFGEAIKSESAISLPLDLAVMMLSGPNGVMDLSLPLSGDLSDPKVGIGQIVRTAIVGLVTNVAAAPFKMLSGLVGAGDADISVVSFAEGSAELEPAMDVRLGSLIEALKERPGLKLVLVPQVSEADVRRLSEEKLKLTLMEGAAPSDSKLYSKRLAQRYRDAMKAAGTPDTETDADQADGFAKMVAALLPTVDLSDIERSALASERASAVRASLVQADGIGEARVVVAEPELDADVSAVRFDLQ